MQSDRDRMQEQVIEHGGHMTELLPRRMLGRTGRTVSILGLGGGGVFFDEANRDQAVEIVNRAIDLGIDYLDTAPSYGASEDLFGEVMRTRRDEVFLATKIHPRSRDEAWRTIVKSLERLRTDHVDMLQIHDIATNEDVDRVAGVDGSLRAALEAKDQGLTHCIGVTGHADPGPILYALERYDFDAVLAPVNVADRHYLSFIERVLPVANERNLGVIGMKVYCAGGVFVELGVLPDEALRYALSQDVATCIVGVDNIAQLLGNIDSARNFQRMGEPQLQALETRVRDVARVCGAKFKAVNGEQ